jgi:hypothetical protein
MDIIEEGYFKVEYFVIYVIESRIVWQLLQ